MVGDNWGKDPNDGWIHSRGTEVLFIWKQGLRVEFRGKGQGLCDLDQGFEPLFLISDQSWAEELTVGFGLDCWPKDVLGVKGRGQQGLVIGFVQGPWECEDSFLSNRTAGCLGGGSRALKALFLFCSAAAPH